MAEARSGEIQKARLVTRAVRGLVRMVPARHELAFELLRHRIRGRLEDELLGLERIVGGRRDLALDIGANQGYYAFMLAKLFERVEAFEPNARTLRRLRAARIPNVNIHAVALSSSVGAKSLFIPEVHGVVHDGWASFDPENLPEATVVEGIQVPVETLDSFGFTGVSFIKIDVEGHELAVLHGGHGTIERCRPVVLSEVKSPNRQAVFGFFRSLDYDILRFVEGELTPYEEDEGVADESDNFVFGPRRSPAKGGAG